MFCYQCEQTAKGAGCTFLGICGKEPTTAALQDLLVYAVKDLSRYANLARQLGSVDKAVNIFTVKALFSTLTNVDFDPDRFQALLREAASIKERAKSLYEGACKRAGKKAEQLPYAVRWWTNIDDLETLVETGTLVGVQDKINELGPDVAGLQELIVYGLKGLAAYADHAQILGKEDDAVYAFIHKILDRLTQKPTDIGELLQTALATGEVNLKAMELLDAGNTGTYGHPEPTQVRVTPIKGKCIVVSGHDLKDLEELLKQTQGKGINVYTHGEMLPCNAYPGLKKYKHLVGNYGGAWQNQRDEFDAFPGAILMTTNCVQKPKDSYKSRIFTSGVVGWAGVTHISNGDFAPVIKAALAAPGFTEDVPAKSITIGFARNTVMSFAQKVPNDCVILTLACGKYRFNKLDFGSIDGIPRLLDCGQCNDAYSAIQIAVALAGAFKCGVNDLPLSFVLSWYEQKAVVILLTLLHLGIKNIKLGPSLPAFISPAALNVLVEKFNIAPVGSVDEDLKAILGAK
jgi:hydroxylamine reductase